MLHGHGGNISAVARRFGLKPSEIIDMSSNINPLGPLEGLMDFLKDDLMSRLYFEDQRKLFCQYLKEISGLKLYPSQGPNVLIRLPAATTSGDA